MRIKIKPHRGIFYCYSNLEDKKRYLDEIKRECSLLKELLVSLYNISFYEEEKREKCSAAGDISIQPCGTDDDGKRNGDRSDH